MFVVNIIIILTKKVKGHSTLQLARAGTLN